MKPENKATVTFIVLIVLWVLTLITCQAWGGETAEPNIPFETNLPTSAPPAIYWYVAEPGQTIFWPANVWTRFGSEAQIDVANADPNGPVWDFAVETVAKAPVDPNRPGQGWNEKLQIGWTVPVTPAVYYVQVTATVTAGRYGDNDLRPRQTFSDSRTWVIKAENHYPPEIWVIDPPVLRIAQKNWQTLFAKASKTGRQMPSKPIKQADGTLRKAPQVKGVK